MSKKTVKLGNICTIYTGTGFPTQYQGESSGDFPFYKVGDISKNVLNGHVYLTDCDNYISKEIAKKIKGTIVPANTVVFAKIGEAVKLNRRAITSTSCLVDNNAMGICPDQSKMLLSYFYHYMCSIKLEKYAEATTVPSVKKSVVENLEIPQLSIKEQRTIADTLDEVDSLIFLRKQQLMELNQLVKSRFIELFSKYESEADVTIEEISDMVTVGIANSATHAYSDSGIIMFRNQNIKEDYLDDGDLIYILPSFAEKYKTKRLQENDILVTRTGYPGVACLVPKEYEDSQTFTTLIVRLKTDSSIVPRYVCSYINSCYGKAFVDEMKVGVAQQNFGAKALAQMPIFIPPLSEQQAFVAFAEHTDKLKLAVTEALAELETLKKSLMQQYFG